MAHLETQSVRQTINRPNSVIAEEYLLQSSGQVYAGRIDDPEKNIGGPDHGHDDNRGRF